MHTEELASQFSTDCNLRYAGQYFDKESGLHYNRFRYYDPESAQYLSSDPIGLNGGLTPQSYTHNPNSFIDPLGLSVCKTDYAKKIDQTPVSDGSWSGPRGESTFTSTKPAVSGKSVNYQNGYPDFKPHTKHTVEIENFVGKVKGTKYPRQVLHAEADKILANRLGVKPGLISKFRRKNKFTWHEVEDMRTLQLVPTSINSKFGHVGGISEALKL